jgi:ribonuclease HI
MALNFRTGYGARVILVPPLGKTIILSYRLNFLCTKTTEYEALIVGICAKLTLGAWIIKILGDLQLVIKQINGTYQVKHDKLSKYKDLTITLLEGFDSYNIDKIPWKDNQNADAMVSATSLINSNYPSIDFTFIVHKIKNLVIDEEVKEVLLTIVEYSSEWYS